MGGKDSWFYFGELVLTLLPLFTAPLHWWLSQCLLLQMVQCCSVQYGSRGHPGLVSSETGPV